VNKKKQKKAKQKSHLLIERKGQFLYCCLIKIAW